MKNAIVFILFLLLAPMAPVYIVQAQTDTTEQIVPVNTDSITVTEAPADAVQIIPGTDEPTLEQLNKWAIPIGVAANWLLTYLMGLFPGFVLFKDDRYKDLSVKALVVAIVVGFVLWKFDFASTSEVLIAFVLSSFGYDKILNPMGLKTKTAAEAKA